MKTILDAATREELIRRIHALTETSPRQWGTMTPYQMAKHCTLWEEMTQGRNSAYKRSFIGRLIGPMVLKAVLKDDKPIKRNSPTVSGFKVGDTGDLSQQKQQWITSIEGYAHFSNPNFVHPFFGKMTKEQVGQLAYKHDDHHLRQFNI